jgi:hypothetical protein
VSCLDADTVLAWVDGRTSRTRAAEIEAHIDGCRACRRLIGEAAAAAVDEEAGEDAREEGALDVAGISPAVRVRPGERPTAGAGEAGRREAGRAARRWWIAGALAAALVLAAGGAIWALRAAGALDRSSDSRTAAPTVVQVLDRPGQVLAARWAAGAIHINAVFGDGLATAGTGALRLARRGKDGALAPLPAADGMMLVAAQGDRLLVLGELADAAGQLRGRLAIVDGEGKVAPVAGAVGDLVRADFLPDGIAAARLRERRLQIEAPLGTVVHEAGGVLRALRASPGGRIAFVEAPPGDDEVARVRTIARGGRPVTVEGDWRDAHSVAWFGEDLLVSGSRAEGGHAVWRLPAGGAGGARLVWSAARRIIVQDASPGGALLVSEVDLARRLFVRRADETADRDLSWSDRSTLADLSRDGAWLSFLEPSPARGEAPAIYVRRVAGGDAIFVGRGVGGALDPSGERVLSRTSRPPWELVETTLASTWDRRGPASRTLARGGRSEAEALDAVGWLDHQRIAYVAGAADGLALYAQPVDGEPVRRGAWPGQLPRNRFRISPDGARIGAVDGHGEPALIDAATLEARPLVGLEGHAIVGWSAAGDAVWVARHDRWPVSVVRYAVATGAASPLLEIAAPAPGAQPPEQLRVAGDGKTYAYSALVIETRLLRVDGALEVGR